MDNFRRLNFCKIAFTAAALFAAVDAGAQTIIHVPAEARDLQAALDRVSDGGIIEIAGGTYNAPQGGFNNYSIGKDITVQAAAGASVTLSGNGTTDIFRFTNDGIPGKPMTFIGITFSNGRMGQNAIGGAITLGRCEITFRNCAFLANATVGSGTAGGSIYIGASNVTFDNCLFSGNQSLNGGGAICSLDSRIFINNCRFIGNRADMPGHNPRSAGGAVYTYNSNVAVTNSVFEDNHAGYVAGAIYGAAPWDAAGVTVDIKNCLFYNNGALRDPSVSFSEPAVGGALHVEENTALRVSHCNFTENVSSQGGAISTYRGLLNVDHSLFKGNKALAVGTSGEGTGGAIIALSGDGPVDVVNRRSVTVAVTDSLFTGTADGSPNAKQGGQIFVGGDPDTAYGRNGRTQNGTPESNRGQLTLQRVTFYQSRVDSTNQVPARGSAVMVDFTRLQGDSVMFLKGDAGSGSATLMAVNDSVVHLNNSTFQRNSATSFGAAITFFGGELIVGGTTFLENFYKSVNLGKGVDILTAPNRDGSGGAGTAMTGLVSNCLFSGATMGGRIYDGAGYEKPYNLLQYSLNSFMPDADGYVSDILKVSPVTVLNTFQVNFLDNTSVKKAPVANAILTALPGTGQICSYAVRAPVVGDASGAVRTTNLVAFAATGPCTVDGSRQGSEGIITSNTGVHSLGIGGQVYTATSAPNVAVNISTRLQVGTGGNVLIAGFIVQGGGPKKVAIRGMGPSLSRAGINGVLADPTIELRNQRGAVIAQNNDWQDDLASRAELTSVGLSPDGPKEAALVVTLDVGAYTVILQGTGGTSGVGLVEVYDLDARGPSTLANISTRGVVAGGDKIMIGGFIVQGENGATNIVVRGIGPSLAKAGLTGTLDDPQLQVYNASGEIVSQNDDWQTGVDASALTSSSLQPTSAKEPALFLRNLPEGSYTAVLRGKDGSSGIGLVEAYVF